MLLHSCIIRFLANLFVAFLVTCVTVKSVTVASAVRADTPGFPDLVLPEGAGVNIHFTRGHERDLDMIAAAGFKFIRMDFSWGGTERKQSTYNWADYDELTSNLEKRGLRAIYNLDYSNSLYEEAVISKNPINGRERKDVASPQHPGSVAAFARWSAEAARHFAGRRIIWEIWNEPNITFWKPKPDVGQYTTLALATVKAVRDADPGATIIGPATSEVPLKFLDEFFSSGILANLDAVSVHPYRPYRKGPETAVEDYRKLRELIEQHAPTPAKRALPIISGEWGYSTFANKGVSLETQAAFLVRQQLSNLVAGIPISIWYDWKDDGTDPAEREHNFGTVTHDLKPKPAYLAFQILARELSGYRIESRLKTLSDQDYLLLFGKDKERKLAAWTTGDAHAVVVEGYGFKTVRSVSGDGSSATTEVGNDALWLTSMPRYLTLGK